jgi:hypothetical protein
MFDPRKHFIKVQGSDYLPTKARVVWFRQDHPLGRIETTSLAIDTEKGFAIFHATIRREDGEIMAQATKFQSVGKFPDYIEKAETGAIGRALGFAGYGTMNATLGAPVEPNRTPLRVVTDSISRANAPVALVADAHVVEPSESVLRVTTVSPAPPKATGSACADCGATVTAGRRLCPKCAAQRDGAMQAHPVATALVEPHVVENPPAAPDPNPEPASKNPFCRCGVRAVTPQGLCPNCHNAARAAKLGRAA